jgi:glycosyltransferase involved in cell wall biosynthesis
MKILMVLDHEFPPDIRVENEISALISENHEVHLACYTRTRQREKDSYAGAFIHRKPISELRYKSSVGCLKFPFYFNFWRSFIRQLHYQYHFDAIHIHDLPLAKIGVEMKNLQGLRFLLDLHENWPALLRVADHAQSRLGRVLSTDKQWREYEIEMCSKADNVIVVVDEALDRLADLGVDSEKIVVVSNTLNQDNFIVPDTRPDPAFLTLFYAGGINRHRGLQFVIRALRDIRSIKPVRLWLLGSGSYIQQLNQLAIENGVDQMVWFAGWKSLSEMNKLMGKADICMIPHTKSDHTDSTLPHKLFQYMYTGKAIVASDCNPIKRIINDCKSGMIYKWNDTDELSETLTMLSVNVELLKTMGNSGRDAVMKHYLWEFDASRLKAIYR